MAKSLELIKLNEAINNDRKKAEAGYIAHIDYECYNTAKFLLSKYAFIENSNYAREVLQGLINYDNGIIDGVASIKVVNVTPAIRNLLNKGKLFIDKTLNVMYIPYYKSIYRFTRWCYNTLDKITPEQIVDCVLHGSQGYDTYYTEKVPMAGASYADTIKAWDAMLHAFEDDANNYSEDTNSLKYLLTTVAQAINNDDLILEKNKK